MLRVLLTPRWVGWTVFLVLVLAVCGAMTWWQIVRLESPGGSLLNAGYAFQWPLFGVFFVFLWARMLHAEARSTPREETRDETRSGIRSGARDEQSPQRPVLPVAASSPFGPRPSGVTVPVDAPEAGSARARHNAHFARLAAPEPPRPAPGTEDRS